MKHNNTSYASTVLPDAHSTSSTNKERMENSISSSISYLDQIFFFLDFFIFCLFGVILSLLGPYRTIFGVGWWGM